MLPLRIGMGEDKVGFHLSCDAGMIRKLFLIIRGEGMCPGREGRQEGPHSRDLAPLVNKRYFGEEPESEGKLEFL